MPSTSSTLLSRSLRNAGLAAASPVVLVALSGCATNSAPPNPNEISGRYIAVMCDADMSWSAFSSGELGERRPGSDNLTIVTLPIALPPDGQTPTWNTTVAQVAVSNSAIGPPVSISVTADGNRAYVCESRGSAPEGATRVEQLPLGSRLTAVDLTNPAQPSVLGTKDVGREPTGCDVHPSGAFVAVVTRNPGAQLVMIPASAEDPLGQPLAWGLLGLPDDTFASCVQWHPGGRHLAVTIPKTNQVAFYEFTPDGNDGQMGLAQWGEPVTVGKYPFSGRFTPDGRYFVTTCLQWGADVEGFNAGVPEGEIAAIRVATVPTARTDTGEIDNSRVVHEIASTATVGVSPECMTISPDGEFIVTGNIKGSHIAEGRPHATPGGSLSLVAIDSGGGLTPISEVPIKALPEGVAFDAGGNHVVVSEFRTFDPGALDGELAFFKLVRGGGGARLVPAKFYVGVGRGPHGVLIVR